MKNSDQDLSALLKQREAELAVINSVQVGLVAEMDMQEIYDLVGDRIRDLFDAQVVSIATFDHENSKEHFQYNVENGFRIYPEARPLDKFRKRLIETKELILINENFPERAEDILEFKPEALPGTGLPKSVLFVPLVLGDAVRGYVSLQNLDHEQAFPDSDARLLSTLANSMSVALENARLFNETEQRNAELAVINSVQEGLVAEMNLQGIYNLVGDRIRELFDAQVAAICTFNHENRTEKFQYLYENGERFYPGERPIDKLRQYLIQSKKMIWINENASEAFSSITGETQTAIPGTKLAKSMVFVPLIIVDTVRGYVTLQNVDHENAFSDSDVRLLNTLANSMSVALENARLFNETEQRNAELAVINSVQEGLVAEVDLQGIYDLVGDKIRDLFDSQVTAIITFNHESKTEDFKYLFEDGQRLHIEGRPYDKVREKLILEQKTLFFNEKAAQTMSEINGRVFKPAPGTGMPQSVLLVPMTVGNNVRGYVTLQNLDRENAFNESDVRLLNTLVNSMSIALENARLFNETVRLLDETEHRATEMQTVNNISRALVSQLELDKLIDLVGEQMRETFKADIVYLALHNRKTNMLNFPYYYGDKRQARPFGNGITEKIILKKEPILINQNLDDAYNKLEAEKKGEIVESYLGVPIMAGSESIGVISVQSKEQENRFNENDMRLLTTIAANVGVAMQNAEAYQNLQEALTELSSAQEQLIQQEKLASLGQLTAGIAHEIKNPLNFVNNFSDVSMEMIDEALEILKKIGENEHAAEDAVKYAAEHIAETVAILADIKSNLAKIHEHGTRADGIVKSMLQHSRGGSGKMEPTDLNGLVKEYVNLAFHGMRAGKNPINVDIDLQLDDSIGDVPLVAEDFSRVILNLCNNAFDAMGDKLAIAVTESGRADGKADYKPKLIVRIHRKAHGGGNAGSQNGGILIEIEDNGPGIPDEIRDKILQPFFTTKKGTAGTGLGLSITHDIIKAHGGELSVNTIAGRGATFRIGLHPNNT